MCTAIRLTVLTGPHRNRRFCFCGPTQCEIGRALECFVQLSGTERDQLISRHHCLLDIDPPEIQVKDLGSSNGTYINGTRISLTPDDTTAETTGMPLRHGDVLTIGGTTLRVELVDCPYATNELAAKPMWNAGQTAKKDCALAC